jgi:hypothetical protein
VRFFHGNIPFTEALWFNIRGDSPPTTPKPAGNQEEFFADLYQEMGHLTPIISIPRFCEIPKQNHFSKETKNADT